MSQEQLKSFLEKVNSDTSLQEQVQAEGSDVVAIAKAAGFTIMQEDLLRQTSVLSEEELESISGGTITMPGW